MGLTYVMSAPAIKHPGFEEIKTMLFTAELSETSWNT